MTTDRPYHRALTSDEAAAELRRGRGTQFAPSVVDAFFGAFRRRSFLRGDEALALDELEQAAG